MTSTKPRRAWLAAVLSLLGGGPVGQVYAGHARRSILLWFLGAVLLPLVVFPAVFLPIGRTGFALLMACALAYPLYLAADAFLLARRDRDAPLKRYQRWWVYVLAWVAFVVLNYALAYATRTFVGEAFVAADTGQFGGRVIAHVPSFIQAAIDLVYDLRAGQNAAGSCGQTRELAVEPAERTVEAAPSVQEARVLAAP